MLIESGWDPDAKRFSEIFTKDQTFPKPFIVYLTSHIPFSTFQTNIVLSFEPDAILFSSILTKDQTTPVWLLHTFSILPLEKLNRIIEWS